MAKTKSKSATVDISNVVSSGLSIDEFLLLAESGFEPAGLVGGGSAYHIGLQQPLGNEGGELEVLTKALYNARRSAMRRLARQAKNLGAAGIVDLRLKFENPADSYSVLQVMGYGTAVRRQADGIAASGRSLFATTLSGHDFWLLMAGGYRPLEIVMGCCVYQVGSQSWLTSLRQTGKNVEMQTLTEALYGARETAVERMEHEARSAKAQGIVGVKVEVTHHRWNGHNVIEFFALGTAVVQSKGASRELPTPATAVNLRP